MLAYLPRGLGFICVCPMSPERLSAVISRVGELGEGGASGSRSPGPGYLPVINCALVYRYEPARHYCGDRIDSPLQGYS
jgi:hypothetical protein